MQEEFAELKVKMKKHHDALNKRIDRLVGSVNHMAQCVDEFNENYRRIIDHLSQATTQGVVNSIRREATFPLESPEELHQYLEDDPECVQLIDR